MTILLISSFYYPSFVGGAEISVQMLAEGLSNAGNRVYVLVTGPTNKVYKVNNVIVISLKQRNIFSICGGTGDVSAALKVVWHLIDSCNVFYHSTIKGLLNRIKPDIIHTNTIQGFSPFIWVAAKSYNVPLVHTTRDYYLLCHKCSLYNGGNCQKLCLPCKVTHSLKSRFVKLPDHIVGISNYILDKHTPILTNRQKASVIYNGVSLTDGAGYVKQPTETICFGYIGRIADDKGVGYLAKELAALNSNYKSKIKVLFAGRGDGKFTADMQIILKGIDHEFLNVVKPEDFYRRIDVLIVPSLWNEPFGRTVIESLSYSVPVCQADTGGLKELYSADTSWMFTPGTGALSAIIKQIVDDKKQIAIKRENCRKQAEKFSSGSYINNHLQLYQQLVPNQLHSLAPHGAPVLL
jgi:glycosyltransferase involved in cell wall biosynthesis